MHAGSDPGFDLVCEGGSIGLGCCTGGSGGGGGVADDGGAGIGVVLEAAIGQDFSADNKGAGLLGSINVGNSDYSGVKDGGMS